MRIPLRNLINDDLVFRKMVRIGGISFSKGCSAKYYTALDLCALVLHDVEIKALNDGEKKEIIIIGIY